MIIIIPPGHISGLRGCRLRVAEVLGQAMQVSVTPNEPSGSTLVALNTVSTIVLIFIQYSGSAKME